MVILLKLGKECFMENINYIPQFYYVKYDTK